MGVWFVLAQPLLENVGAWCAQTGALRVFLGSRWHRAPYVTNVSSLEWIKRGKWAGKVNLL